MPATYSDPFIRLTMKWQLPGGEVANCSTSWWNETATGEISDAIADALATRALAFWTDLSSAYTATCLYAGCKVSLIATDGVTVDSRERAISPAGGNLSESNLPSECAVCVSLRTQSASRAGRGRFFLPAPGAGRINTAGRLTSTVTDDIADAAVSFLAPVATGSLVPVVASQTAAGHQPLTGVRVGDVLDVQRRRRDALVEVYDSRTL